MIYIKRILLLGTIMFLGVSATFAQEAQITIRANVDRLVSGQTLQIHIESNLEISKFSDGFLEMGGATILEVKRIDAKNWQINLNTRNLLDVINIKIKPNTVEFVNGQKNSSASNILRITLFAPQIESAIKKGENFLKRNPNFLNDLLKGLSSFGGMGNLGGGGQNNSGSDNPLNNFGKDFNKNRDNRENEFDVSKLAPLLKAFGGAGKNPGNSEYAGLRDEGLRQFGVPPPRPGEGYGLRPANDGSKPAISSGPGKDIYFVRCDESSMKKTDSKTVQDKAVKFVSSQSLEKLLDTKMSAGLKLNASIVQVNLKNISFKSGQRCVNVSGSTILTLKSLSNASKVFYLVVNNNQLINKNLRDKCALLADSSRQEITSVGVSLTTGCSSVSPSETSITEYISGTRLYVANGQIK